MGLVWMTSRDGCRIRDHQPGLSQGFNSKKVPQSTLETMGSFCHILQKEIKFMSSALSLQISSSMSSWPSRLITWLRLRA